VLGKRQPINIPPGVNKDDNAETAFVYTDADKIRFHQGFPEKIGGWWSIGFGNSETINGVVRSIFSITTNDSREHVLLGSNTNLYSYESGNLYNITPFVTATTAIPNSLSSNYDTLTTDPIFVSDGSRLVTIAFSPFVSTDFQVGDAITISGVGAAIGGIPAGDINGVQSVWEVLPSAIIITVNTEATSSASGGGASVVIATKLISVSQIGHGFSNGDRVKILAATGFAGFAAGDLNVEAVIRNVSTNSYDYYLSASTNYATSSATAAGGASTTVQGQIAAGECSFTPLVGYGGANYGDGLYGVPKTFSNGALLPRIWAFDKYGETVVMTPGNQTGVYQWNMSINTSPTLVANAPSAVNYVFVGANQVITFGASNVPNRIKTSDTADITNWTIDATSSAFEVDLLDTGRLICHGYVRNQYLIFSEDSVYKMQFVGKPRIWQIDKIYGADGVLSPKTVAQLPDAVAWWGQNDFYVYDGSLLSSIPNNKLLHWSQDKMNWGKYYLSFARRVLEFNEIWWFFPTDTDEPDTYLIWNFQENHFTNGRLSRTASEEPANPLREQYMAAGSCDDSISNTLYQHERDFADNGANMEGSLKTNFAPLGEGDYVQKITRIVPSNYLLPVGSTTTEKLYTLNVNMKEYAGQLNPRVSKDYDVYSQTTKLDTRLSCRLRQYNYTFANKAGFRIQLSYEETKPGTRR
jgi:hypothetical protein